MLRKGNQPNSEAMEAAAEALDLELPEGHLPRVKFLRKHFEDLKIPEDDRIECAKCGEYTNDDERIQACPFCGSEGEEDEGKTGAVDLAEGEAEAAEPEEPKTVDVDAEEKPKRKPKADPKAALAKVEKTEPATTNGTALAKVNGNGTITPAQAMEIEHRDVVRIIEAAKEGLAATTYDLGCALIRAHDKDTWKIDGHKTFKAFLDSVGLTHSYGFDVMALVKKYDRETFQSIGRKKLMLIARANEEERPKLLEAAKSGATASQLERKISQSKGTTKAAAPKPKEREAAPAPEQSIVLLAKTNGRPKEFKFLDRKTREEVTVWTDQTYVEIPISEDVSQYIALKTNDKGKIVGLTSAFRRVEPEEREAAKKDAPKDTPKAKEEKEPQKLVKLPRKKKESAESAPA